MENSATTQLESKDSGSSKDELRVVVITEEPRMVQHVAKASSDQLLRKFADSDDDDDGESPPAKRKTRVPKRQRRSRWIGEEEDKENCGQSSSTNGNNCSLVERKSLLPTTATTRKSTFLRQLGIARSQFRARDIRNKSIMRAIHKTWRQTVEGASRVFIERHYNKHNRLINDSV